MHTEPNTFDLAELADSAEVTPRTVRYYVQQGLLPSPGTRGPGARYDSRHLDRLQLIKRLQHQHLPLAEIRRRLESLDDDSVRDAVRALPEPPQRSSALDYVREVLSTQPGKKLSRERGLSRISKQRAPEDEDMLFAERIPAPTVRAARASWDRIALSPDVELHVRRPLTREQNKLVERLLDVAEHLFAEEHRS